MTINQLIKRFFIFVFLAVGATAFAQSTLVPADNMPVASNTTLKFQPGSYPVVDSAGDGVIRIVNQENIVIDGDSVEVTGTGFNGYFIYIYNSRNITIRNFKAVKNYYYAVAASMSSGIHVIDNDFSYNKKDTLGWINIWTDTTAALGGGVLMYRCSESELYGNRMTQNNDGIALYNCDNITAHDNILNWNCTFGIRMNYTDNCHIHHNDCSHVNRKNDQSDCAAILLIVSNNNTVEYNNLTYSGDGVFLGQYRYSDIPNNNYFAYNDCSYSPHNAIEATFADGNVYRHNICNYSNYGFWLGYSFNSVVEDNDITGNSESGIAVDRGFSNTFKDNLIRNNPVGIELWEGDPIEHYADQSSHDYYITGNTIEGNGKGISAIHSEHLIARNNQFVYNQTHDLYLAGLSISDTVAENTFRAPTVWFLENASTDPVDAPDNTFLPNIDSLIYAKISGNVNFQPYNREPQPVISWNPPCDMAERPAVWTPYREQVYGQFGREALDFDYSDKKVGASSVKLYTMTGFDQALNYRPGGDSLALWNLSQADTLAFWVKTQNKSSYGFQNFFIRVGDFTGNYYQYTAASTLLNNARNTWKRYRMPLKGNSNFIRSKVGNMDFSRTNYVEFHADTWDAGFTISLDGVQFRACTPTGTDDTPVEETFRTGCYPNPFSGETTLWFDLPERAVVHLSVFDLTGRCLKTLVNEELPEGKHLVAIPGTELNPGLYLYRLNAGNRMATGRLVRTGQ